MKRRVRFHSIRTQRCNKYLKPGALARLRDSRIQSHVRVKSVIPLVIQSISTQQENSPNTQIEILMPEFPGSDRGPKCFGRKKLVAAKNYFINSLDSTPGSDDNDSFISIVNPNLLVH
ncbi:unnamed protein product [Amaranthus hypochondriacus]